MLAFRVFFLLLWIEFGLFNNRKSRLLKNFLGVATVWLFKGYQPFFLAPNKVFCVKRQTFLAWLWWNRKPHKATFTCADKQACCAPMWAPSSCACYLSFRPDSAHCYCKHLLLCTCVCVFIPGGVLGRFLLTQPCVCVQDAKAYLSRSFHIFIMCSY